MGLVSKLTGLGEQDTTTAHATEGGFAKLHLVDAVAAKWVDQTKGTDLHSAYQTMLGELRSTFRAGTTKPLAWRKQQLRQLVKLVSENTDAIIEAIKADLGGPDMRGVFEMGSVEQAQFALKNLDRWAKDEALPWGSPWARSVVRREPKGVVLIIAPWNFPIELALNPLVAVLAAGNCCVIKPSEMAEASCALLTKLVPQYFPPEAVRVVTGGVTEVTALLELRWDHILYTGNGSVGRKVMAAAAKHLTPVTLELGGKSAVIVDRSAKVGLAAKRIAQGKWISNAGQVCISPDFVLVHESLEQPLLAALAAEAREIFGETRAAHGVDAAGEEARTAAMGKIINARHVERLKQMLDGCGGELVTGDAAQIDAGARYVPPILVSRPREGSELLTHEVFGPVLGVVPVADLDEAIERARAACEHPLALYVFAEERKAIEKVLSALPSGGAAVNSTMEHALNPAAPFGGVGESGMGAYHGRAGFEEFSHRRSLLYRTTLLPLTMLPPVIKHGRVPTWVAPLFLKVLVTGFVPPRARQALHVVAWAAAVAAGAMIAHIAHTTMV